MPSPGQASVIGAWGSELRQAGWDAVVLEGRASSPLYVAVRNESVELRDASSVWGVTCAEAGDLIRVQLESADARVVCIGPAGENGAAPATLHDDLAGTAEAPGSGAMLGRMNCKGIAVRGTRGVPLSDDSGFLRICIAAHKAVRGSDLSRQVHASHGSDVPNDWQQRRVGCVSCPVSCLDNYHASTSGGFVVGTGLRRRVQEEHPGQDTRFWIEFARECDQQGLDLLSMARIVRWLRRLDEAEVLPASLVRELGLASAAPVAARAVLTATAESKGFGQILALGLEQASARLAARIREAASPRDSSSIALSRTRSRQRLPNALFFGPSTASSVSVTVSPDLRTIPSPPRTTWWPSVRRSASWTRRPSLKPQCAAGI